MSLVTSTQNPFNLVDRTEELLMIPQNPTLMNDSGMWREEFLSTRTVTFEERKGELFIIKDQVDNGRPVTSPNEVRKLHAYGMTHHPYVDALFPQDIAAVSRPGQIGANQLDTKERKLIEKMETIRKSYDRTLNLARFRTLAAGDIWSPNGNLQGNFYTDFGITRKITNFNLDNPTFKVLGACEEVIANFMSQGTGGENIDRVTAYCSGKFFSKLISHPSVQAAYNLYAVAAPQQISRDRAGGMSFYRRFVFSNIEFIEVVQVVDGSALIADGDAIFVADDGDGSFRTYYGPAMRFGYVNTTAASGYLWTFEDPRGTQVTIEAEMNMINILRKPGLVSTGKYVP